MIWLVLCSGSSIGSCVGGSGGCVRTRVVDTGVSFVLKPILALRHRLRLIQRLIQRL